MLFSRDRDQNIQFARFRLAMLPRYIPGKWGHKVLMLHYLDPKALCPFYNLGLFFSFFETCLLLERALKSLWSYSRSRRTGETVPYLV